MISMQKLRGVRGGSSLGTRSRILAFLVLAVCLLALPPGVWADTATWSGATDFDYNTLTNWAGPPVSIPGTNATETATFTNTGVGNVGISAATTFAVGFAFSNTGANAYTITVANGVTQGLTDVTITGTGAVTIAGTGTGAVSLAAGVHTFNIGVQPNLNTTISLGISGAGSIDKTGDGALVLSGNNSYIGGTTLDAGSLNVGHANALGTGGLTINSGTFQAQESTVVSVSNAVTIGGNFAFGGNSALTLSGTVDLGGATRTITMNNTADTTLSGVISNGGITTAGTGTLTLGGVNTYTGATTIGAGSTLALNATGTIATSSGVANAGTFTIAASKTIDSLTGAGATTLGGILTIGDATGTSGTYSGVASGAGGITTAGTGTLTLGGVNTYTGATTIGAGSTLALNATGTIADSSGVANAGTFTIAASKTIDSLTGAGGTTLTAGTLTIGDATGTSGTYSGVATGAGGITKAGTGTLTLSGANTYSGTTTLTAGTLAAGNNSALGTGGLTINGGTLQASGGARSLANDVTVGGNFTFGGANDLTLSSTVDLGGGTRTLTVSNTANTNLTGVISNGGLSINNTGGATIELSGNNTYADGTTLTAGTLAVSHNSALGTGGLAINGGTLTNTSGGTLTLSNNVTVGGNFTLDGYSFILSGTANLGGATRTLNVVSNYNHTLSGIISNGGLSINNTGSGTLTLSGANTYAGNTALTAGTLLAGNNTAFGIGGTLTINGGTIGASAASITVANTLGVVGGNFAMGGAAGTNLELTQALNLGTNTLTHSGASSDTLSGNVTNGNINVTAGTLTLSGAGANSANLATNGGTLNMNGGAGTTFTGTATVTTGTLNFTGGDLSGLLTLTGGTFNISGTAVYSNGAALVNSAGTTFNIVAGDNITLAGGLTNNGTATINGTLTGNLTNNAGALVGGSGTITGNLINNGTVNPGNSPGTLTVGTYTVNPGATHVVEIASASSYDKLVATTGVAGAVTLNGGTLSPRLLGGYLPSHNQVFSNILQTTGASGTVVGTFASIDNTRVGNSRTLFWQANYYASSVDLQAVGNYTPADLTLSRNQRSVGNMLNALSPSVTSGDMLTVFNAIDGLTSDGGVRAAYNEISPGKYAALPTMTMPITHMQFQSMQNRLARERWEAELGSEAVSAGGGGFMRNFNFGYENNTKMLLAASNMTFSDAGTPLIRKGVEQRWGIYLEPMANWGSQNSTANMVGYRYKNFGFTLGAEYWVMDNLLVGVNTGYSKTLGGVGGGGGDLNANVIPFNAYGAFFMQGFYANATLGYTYSGYDMERNIAFGTINRTAKASTSGNQFQLGAETGYDAKIGNAVVGPVVSLQYATQTVDGFTESNAGALSLKVGSQSADSVQTGIGARASYKAKVGNIAVKPQLSVSWQHEFSDNTRGLNASLAAGGSTMNFRTDKIGQNFALISVDVPAKVTKNLVAHIGYTAEVGRDKSTNMGVNIGLKYKF